MRCSSSAMHCHVRWMCLTSSVSPGRLHPPPAAPAAPQWCPAARSGRCGESTAGKCCGSRSMRYSPLPLPASGCELSLFVPASRRALSCSASKNAGAPLRSVARLVPKRCPPTFSVIASSGATSMLSSREVYRWWPQAGAYQLLRAGRERRAGLGAAECGRLADFRCCIMPHGVRRTRAYLG